MVSPVRVLIAPDKFKGTLTAKEATAAIARGWRRVRPGDRIERLPISDGGDGFGTVFAQLFQARPRRTRTVDAAGNACLARWWWDASRRTAIIESAEVIGLALLPAGQFHPFDLDTRGLAAVLRSAVRAGARRCVLGIGGSATNDGGFGLARGLGWRFLRKDGTEIKHWPELTGLARVVRPTLQSWPMHLTVAVDVRNRLLGRLGCSRVYGPQKGLREFDRAQAALAQLAKVMRRTLGRDVAALPGSGAAGGLGFGLVAFTGAALCPGFDLVARAADLDARLRRVDLVITGEGRIDRSTFMGKAVGQLASHCQKAGVPCLALAGIIEAGVATGRRFRWAGALTAETSGARACAEARTRLEALAAEAARWYELE